MTVAKLRKSLQTLNEDDRLYLLHYLRHLSRVDSEANKRDLTRRHQEIEGGRKVTLAQIKRLDIALKTEGL